MNPDNPYAAPQTSLLHAEQSPLPVASAVGRNLFPDINTSELNRLAGWSISIESMSLVWGVLFTLCRLAFIVQWGFNPEQWYSGAALLLAGVRMWGGTVRTPIYWAYNLVLDALFALATLWAAIHLAKFDFLAVLLVGGVALLFLGLACASVATHFAARPLYGHFPQRELVAEIGYRKQNHIE